MTPSPRARTASRVAFFLSLVAIAVATMTQGSTTTPSGWCLVCGEHGTADAIRNVLLFVPLGATALLATGSLALASTVGPALSLAVELTQLGIPGRDASLGDLVFNTLGSLAGVLLAVRPAAWLTPSRSAANWHSTAAAAGALLLVWACGHILMPDLPSTTYYGQWTPELGQFDSYHGRVLSASIGGVAIPSRRLTDSDRIRDLLRGGAPLSVHAVAGPPPSRLAPIFSIFDELQQEVLVLGARQEDLTLRARTRAAALRLETPELQVSGALSGIEAGQAMHILATRGGGGWCVTVRRGGDSSHESWERCGIGHTIASGWQFVVPAGARRLDPLLADAMWLFALFIPAGFWLRPDPIPIATLLAAAGGLIAMPAITTLVAPSPWLLAVPALGVAFGLLFRRLLDRSRPVWRHGRPWA